MELIFGKKFKLECWELALRTMRLGEVPTDVLYLGVSYPDPHWSAFLESSDLDRDPKIFFYFFPEKNTIKKIKPWTRIGIRIHFKTPDPDPNEMDADPKPCFT